MMAGQISSPATAPASSGLNVRQASISALTPLPNHSATGAMAYMPAKPAISPARPPAAMLAVVPGTLWPRQKVMI